MQSKLGSMIETWTNTFSGLLINMCLGTVVYPLFGHAFSLFENFKLALFFTVVSLIRGYGVRRGFNWLHANGVLK